jgi:hypothetical protein
MSHINPFSAEELSPGPQISFLELFPDHRLLEAFPVLGRQGLMDGGIEPPIGPLDWSDAAFGHEVEDLLADQFDAFAEASAGGVLRPERPIKVVEHQENVLQNVGQGELVEFVLIAFEAFAKIVRFGQNPQDLVLSVLISR